MKLKNLTWIVLTGSLAFGNFACNSGSLDYTAEIEKISKRTGYSEDKIYNMIDKTLNRMMSIPDQPQAIVKRQNYEMKAEIGKKKFYRLADEFGNQDYMTNKDEIDSLYTILINNPKVGAICNKLLDNHLGNNDGKIDEKESERINAMEQIAQEDINKRFKGLNKYFPGLIALEEEFN